MASSTVLFIDGDLWEPFGQFAAALAQHGIASDHLTVAPRHWQSRYSQLLERRLYRRTAHHVERTGADGSRARVSPQQVLRWVGPDTLDVQARDDVGHQLLNESARAIPMLHHARALEPPSAIYDKWFMGELARESGVPTPLSWPAEQGPRQLPAVLKVPVGFGGQGVVTVNQREQWDPSVNSLRAHVAGEPFAQEFLGAGMVNVGGVAAGGEIVTAASYRPVPPAGDPLGPPVAIEMLEHAQARHCAEALVAATGFHGIFTIDFVLDTDGRAFFVDFNPRVFGAWAALQQLGVDLIGAYLFAVGIGPRPPRSEHVHGGRARTLGPPPGVPRKGGVHLWLRSSLKTIAMWEPWLGSTWSTQARARLLAYAARQAVRHPRHALRRPGPPQSP